MTEDAIQQTYNYWLRELEALPQWNAEKAFHALMCYSVPLPGIPSIEDRGIPILAIEKIAFDPRTPVGMSEKMKNILISFRDRPKTDIIKM